MTSTSPPRGAWRTVDIVVAAVISVAFGVVFIAWNAIYTATGPLFAAIPPVQALMYGVWLMPAVLVALIVRRPGAALFGGFLAAGVSVLLGSPYGGDALISGAIQGAAAELGFAVGLYRRWTLPFALLAGGLAGIAAAVHDVVLYYRETGVDFWAVYAAATVVSGVLVAGLGAWLLLRGLVATGVLAPFEVGRQQREV